MNESRSALQRFRALLSSKDAVDARILFYVLAIYDLLWQVDLC